jgi:hypothetical protein
LPESEGVIPGFNTILKTAKKFFDRPSPIPATPPSKSEARVSRLKKTVTFRPVGEEVDPTDTEPDHNLPNLNADTRVMHSNYEYRHSTVQRVMQLEIIPPMIEIEDSLVSPDQIESDFVNSSDSNAHHTNHE